MNATGEQFQKLVRQVHSLPTLPTILLKITELVNNPKTSAIQLGRVIAEDPVLTAKLLKIVNSPFYGFPRKISTVTEAIAIIGFNALKNLGYNNPDRRYLIWLDATHASYCGFGTLYDVSTLVILWFAVFRRVGGLLDRRRDDIAERLRKLEEDRLELARLKEEAHQHLIDAEREALARLNASVEEAAALRDQILQQAHAGAEAELERARETIARETVIAIRRIRVEVADLAIQAAERILDENLDSERNRRLVNEFIERVPSRTA